MAGIGAFPVVGNRRPLRMPGSPSSNASRHASGIAQSRRCDPKTSPACIAGSGPRRISAIASWRRSRLFVRGASDRDFGRLDGLGTAGRAVQGDCAPTLPDDGGIRPTGQGAPEGGG